MAKDDVAEFEPKTAAEKAFLAFHREREARQAAERRAEAAERALAEIASKAEPIVDALMEAGLEDLGMDLVKICGIDIDTTTEAEREPATPLADAARAEGGDIREQITPDDFDGMIDVANDPESAVGRLRVETRRIPMREDTDQ